jgi:hypothetical protein
LRQAFLLIGLGLGLAAALVLLRAALWRPLELVGECSPDPPNRVSGVVHVHTNLSDGGGTPEEVIAAAKAAGLGFVVLTDHNHLDAKPFEGYHDGVLVLVGSEIATVEGHVLGLGITDPVFRFSGDGRDALEDVRDLGGVAFAAHPTSPVPAFRFSGWDLPGPWGLELMNGDSQWREAGLGRLAKVAFLYSANSHYALLGSLTPPDAALKRWDALLAGRNVPALAGADAHSRLPVLKERGVRFPSYGSLFDLFRNHVLVGAPLTGDLASDGRVVIDSLGRGRSYIGLDALAPARGFVFEAEGAGSRYGMGDTVPLAAAPRLRAGGCVPKGARVSLFRDGQLAAAGEGSVELTADRSGVYRVEVSVPGWPVPWVISNPIYVFDAEAALARDQRAAWTGPMAPRDAVRVLDDFEGKTVFEPAADSATGLSRPFLDPKGGKEGSAAAHLEFELGIPTPNHPHVYAAMVAWGERDLRGHQGLTFSIRADGAYRIWVQVRDENPASADEGTEWWFASVKTGVEWRGVAVPFSRLRSINPRTDGRVDLDRVRAIVFVLDKGSVKPGTRGSIWIDDVGLY